VLVIEQLELPLEWRLLNVEECPHKVLRVDGVMFKDTPEAFDVVTCYNPNAPHCGGTFDESIFHYNAAIRYNGSFYILNKLSEWYAKEK